jgi:hypothetical protein
VIDAFGLVFVGLGEVGENEDDGGEEHGAGAESAYWPTSSPGHWAPTSATCSPPPARRAAWEWCSRVRRMQV